ncbi:MAG: late competence development ComFB family protein [Oscillospiraceae bacterium]|nr:late competence development ComFB family protein [Oscillospiraceae bacterium]
MEIRLRNYMEDVVSYNLDAVVRAAGGCTCETCRMDVMAIALNQLKPCYVVTKKGEVYARTGELAMQNAADVISAITKGAEIVGARPCHPEEEDAQE